MLSLPDVADEGLGMVTFKIATATAPRKSKERYLRQQEKR
jgi:hypothetical protein